MFAVVTSLILYVFGFVFLYGVIRLAVRHALEDLEVQRARTFRAEQMATAQDGRFLRGSANLANG